MALTVVTGPPCSGKSYYVAQHAAENDVVIDLDRIALALAPEGTGHHDYPDHVRHVARRARLASIDAALPLVARGITVWIIEANPSPGSVTFYRRRGARFVHCTATPDEITARLADRPLRNQQLIASLG